MKRIGLKCLPLSTTCCPDWNRVQIHESKTCDAQPCSIWLCIFILRAGTTSFTASLVCTGKSWSKLVSPLTSLEVTSLITGLCQPFLHGFVMFCPWPAGTSCNQSVFRPLDTETDETGGAALCPTPSSWGLICHRNSARDLMLTMRRCADALNNSASPTHFVV